MMNTSTPSNLKGRMLISLLAEALAVTADNLDMNASFLVFAQEASEEFSPETQQKLNLLQFALSMALQALKHDELLPLVDTVGQLCSFLLVVTLVFRNSNVLAMSVRELALVLSKIRWVLVSSMVERNRGTLAIAH
jgi:hypothetical protein